MQRTNNSKYLPGGPGGPGFVGPGGPEIRFSMNKNFVRCFQHVIKIETKIIERHANLSDRCRKDCLQCAFPGRHTF